MSFSAWLTLQYFDIFIYLYKTERSVSQSRFGMMSLMASLMIISDITHDQSRDDVIGDVTYIIYIT